PPASTRLFPYTTLFRSYADMTPSGRRYFDEIEVGEEFESPGRTVTETDIVLFAGLSGDYNVLHTDAEFMKKSIFGERIAHGLLGDRKSTRLNSSHEWIS